MTANDCRGAVDEILRRWPGSKIRSLDYRGIVEGKEWWEYTIVLKEEVS